MNDLWRYRVSDSTWTWISGSNKILQLGVYGEKGKANPNNFPGARYGAFGWYDNLREEFWLFGGLGYDNTSSGSCGQSLHQTIPLNIPTDNLGRLFK